MHAEPCSPDVLQLRSTPSPVAPCIAVTEGHPGHVGDFQRPPSARDQSEDRSVPLFAASSSLDPTASRELRRKTVSLLGRRQHTGQELPNAVDSSTQPPGCRKRVILVNRRNYEPEKVADNHFEDFERAQQSNEAGENGLAGLVVQGDSSRNANLLASDPVSSPQSVPTTLQAVPGRWIRLVRRSSTPDLRSPIHSPQGEILRSKTSPPVAESSRALPAETSKPDGAGSLRPSSPSTNLSLMARRSSSPEFRSWSTSRGRRSPSPGSLNRAMTRARLSWPRPALKKTLSLECTLDVITRKSVHFEGQFVQTRTFRQWASSAAVAELPTSIGDPPEEGQVKEEKNSERDVPSSRKRPGRMDCEIVPINVPVRTTLFHGKAVLLESVCVGPDGRSVSGLAQVANYAYAKEVAVRYTFDNWTHHIETAAEFWETVLPRTHNFPGIDRFVFTIPIPERASELQQGRGSAALLGIFANIPNPRVDLVRDMAFVLRYRVAGETYWDNNEKRNYLIRIRLPPRALDEFPEEDDLAPNCQDLESVVTPPAGPRWSDAGAYDGKGEKKSYQIGHG